MYENEYDKNLKNKHKSYLVIAIIFIVCFFIYELVKKLF